MPFDQSIEIHSKFFRWSKRLSITVITIGILVLIGWQFDIEFLKRPIPKQVAMNPLTAVLFIFSGSSLLLMQSKQGKRSLPGITLALFVILVGGLKLSSIILNFDLYLDSILFSSKIDVDAISNIYNRMAPNTALGFVISGLSLLFITSVHAARQIAGQVLALIISFLALLSILGYMYHVQSFYGVKPYIPMAIHTAIAFMFISIAILFSNSEKGIMMHFSSKYAGSISARFLVPSAILIPSILGFLGLHEYLAGMFSAEFGIAILVLSIIIIFLGLIWYNAAKLNNKDILNKEAEKQIKETNDFLNAILENIPDMIVVKEGSRLRFMKFNKAGEELLGVKQNALIGKSDYDFFPKDEADFFTKNDRAVLEKGELLDIKEEPIMIKGEERWLHTKKLPIVLNDKQYLIVISQDITEKRKYEEHLRSLNAELELKVEERTNEILSNEKRFRAMIESSTDVISLTDENNIVIYINPAIENISGYTIQEIKSMSPFDLIFPEDRDQAIANYNKVIHNPGKTINTSFRIKHKNGDQIWLEGIIKNMLNDHSINAIVSNYQDVTKRKESEEKIIAGEKKFKATIDNMLEGIQIHDFNWRYTYVNDTLVKYSQYSKEELLGHTLMEKYPGIEETDLFKTMQRCMNERRSEHLETEFTFPNGSKSFFELSIQPIPEGIFILSIDISERKKAQNEIAELNRDLEKKVYERTEQLESANKEMESFSYSVSHDLRAPLRAINGYAKMIEEDYGKTLDDEGNRLLTTIQYNAQRMGNLIDDLLAFSRLGRKEINKTDLDIEELVEGSIGELNKTIEHKAEIKIEKLYNSKGDYALITQVFYNLISNAIKYSSKKDHPVVKISSELKDDQIVYCINDNGAGFDMKYAGKLFGVFQRLHSTEEFEGTGVGLAIVQRIINKHGGKVWANAKVNEGASFYFSLPIN